MWRRSARRPRQQAARLAALGPAAACVVLVLAAAVLFQHRGTLWNRDLAALSPVPAAAQSLDAELRAQLGAADVGHLVVVGGPDLETVLRRAGHGPHRSSGVFRRRA